VWTCQDCDSASHATRCNAHVEQCVRCCDCRHQSRPHATEEQRKARIRFSVEGKLQARASDREFERSVVEPYNNPTSVDDDDGSSGFDPASYLAALVEQYSAGPWVLAKDREGDDGARAPPNLGNAVARAGPLCATEDFSQVDDRAGRYFGTAASRAVLGVLARIAPNDVPGAWRIVRRMVDDLLGMPSDTTRERDRERDRAVDAMISVGRYAVSALPRKSLESKTVRSLFAAGGRKWYSQQLLGQESPGAGGQPSVEGGGGGEEKADDDGESEYDDAAVSDSDASSSYATSTGTESSESETSDSDGEDSDDDAREVGVDPIKLKDLDTRRAFRASMYPCCACAAAF
jgi:hypothetical protein